MNHISKLSPSKYYIDQSGKVEDTHRLTIIAMTNGKAFTISISAIEKQKLIGVMKLLDHPQKNYIYKIFTGLIFLLVSRQKADGIVIDKEYPGHEADIKLFLLLLYKNSHLTPPDISFTIIGKKHLSHQAAISAYRRFSKPDLIAKTEDILNLFYTSKKGWRSPSRRDKS